MFEMTDRDGLARICKLEVHGKRLETPAMLPVINPRNASIDPRRMKDEFGFHAVITNSFIILKDKQLKEAALEKGVHKLIGFDGIVMTDSGTFQEHVYGDIDVVPIDIVSFQRDIGSDIGTILDIFSEPNFSHEKATDAVEKTISRAREATLQKGNMWLSGPVQGSLFEDLRTRCAEELSEIDLQLHPIGGVVPLMENYRFADLVSVIVASKKGLNPSRPVHLFGAGHPMLFPLAVLLGCDMFDSASYAKFARDDRMMFADGTASLKDLSEFWCQCRVCSRHTPKELLEMNAPEREALIAEHNLFECQSQIKRVKAAIREGTLWELVEKTCRGHPRLLDALRTLPRFNEYLERFEPLSRVGALMATGSESFHRPAIWRYQKRFFERYSHPNTQAMIGLPEAGKPYSRTYGNLLEKTKAHLVVLSKIGPVPIELDEIYPVAQFFPPEIADESIERENNVHMERFAHEQRYGIAVLWENEETLNFVNSIQQTSEPFEIDRARVKAVLSFQFGKKAARAIENADLTYVKSKTKGRIRNIMVNGVHMFSIRASDGYISLTDDGARLIHSIIAYPEYRVTIESDAAPFIEKGSNVFAKFVKDADENLRIGDEALIVDSQDNLVGHGRCMMAREEMLSFKRGMAVRTRSHSAEEE